MKQLADASGEAEGGGEAGLQQPAAGRETKAVGERQRRGGSVGSVSMGREPAAGLPG